MIKFLDSDRPKIMAEAFLEGFDNIDDPEQFEKFIIRRKRKIEGAKDSKKSKAAKDSWRKNRKKYEKGIDKFHKSNQGKRFHRNLTRFNLRNFKSSSPSAGSNANTKRESYEVRDIIALNSMKTCVNICHEYMVPGISDQIRWNDFYEYVNSELTNIIMMVENGKLINEDQMAMLLDLTHESEIEKIREESNSKDLDNLLKLKEFYYES